MIGKNIAIKKKEKKDKIFVHNLILQNDSENANACKIIYINRIYIL